MSGHRWEKLKAGRRITLPLSFCPRCGLIWLKNEASYRAAKQACPAGEP